MVIKYIYEKWNEDFSEARNKSIELSDADWCVYCDISDLYSTGLLLRKMIVENNEIADVITANVFAKCEDGIDTHLLHARCWRNKKEYRWRKKIHEDILLSIKENKGRSVSSDLVFRHTGYEAKGSTFAKNRRNLKIMKKHVINNPKADSLDLFHLVNTYILLATEARKTKSWVKNKKALHYLDQADKAIDRCLAIPLLETDNLWPKMVFMKARIYHETNRTELAKEWYKKTIESQDYIESHLGMAEILVAEHKFEAALGHLEAMMKQGLATGIKISSVPKNMEELEHGMWYNLGLCYFNLENYKQAKEAFQKAVLIYNNDIRSIDFLCECLRREGNHAFAFNVTLESVNRNPGYVGGWVNLGAFELLNKRYATARVFFEHALRLNPKHEQARKNLEMITKGLN